MSPPNPATGALASATDAAATVRSDLAREEAT